MNRERRTRILAPMFRTVRWLLAVVAVFVIAVAGYARSTGLNALDTPGPMEARVARLVRGFAVPARVRARTNPIPSTPEAIAEGLAHFADHCASCHANDGSGHTQLGHGFYPKVPDMRATATQELTDGELFWIIENGVRFTGMPGWATGTEAGEADSWRLVHFIRRLPRLTDEEKARMESLNPRSPEQIRQEIEEQRFLQGGP